MNQPRFFQLRHGAHLLKVRNTTLTVGRRISSDIVLRDPRASRNHARIIVGDDSAAIEDLESANGVYVNGERIDGLVPLGSGDCISIGQERIDVVGFKPVGGILESEEKTASGGAESEVLISMHERK